jgi:hypothetical protein
MIGLCKLKKSSHQHTYLEPARLGHDGYLDVSKAWNERDKILKLYNKNEEEQVSVWEPMP